MRIRVRVRVRVRVMVRVRVRVRVRVGENMSHNAYMYYLERIATWGKTRFEGTEIVYPTINQWQSRLAVFFLRKVG